MQPHFVSSFRYTGQKVFSSSFIHLYAYPISSKINLLLPESLGTRPTLAYILIFLYLLTAGSSAAAAVCDRCYQRLSR